MTIIATNIIMIVKNDIFLITCIISKIDIYQPIARDAIFVWPLQGRPAVVEGALPAKNYTIYISVYPFGSRVCIAQVQMV